MNFVFTNLFNKQTLIAVGMSIAIFASSVVSAHAADTKSIAKMENQLNSAVIAVSSLIAKLTPQGEVLGVTANTTAEELQIQIATLKNQISILGGAPKMEDPSRSGTSASSTRLGDMKAFHPECRRTLSKSDKSFTSSDSASETKISKGKDCKGNELARLMAAQKEVDARIVQLQAKSAQIKARIAEIKSTGSTTLKAKFKVTPEVLGVSVVKEKEVEVAALQAQLNALILQRDNFSKKIANLDIQIVALKAKIEQITNPAVKPTPRFNGFSASGDAFVTVSAVFSAPSVSKPATGPVLLGKINWGDAGDSESVSALVTGKQMTIDLKHTYKVAGTYIITLTDRNGKTATQKVVVNPMLKAPICDAFTATPSTLPATGGNVTLAWATSNATAVHINLSDTNIVQEPNDGSKIVNVLKTSTFVLNLSNAQQAKQCSVTVTVGAKVAAHVKRESYDGKPIADLSPEFAQASFLLTVNVTADDHDVYIPKIVASKLGVPNTGFLIGFKDQQGKDVSSNVRVLAVSSNALVNKEGRYVVSEGESETFTINATFYADKKIDNDYTFVLKEVRHYMNPDIDPKMHKAAFEGGVTEIRGDTGYMYQGTFGFKG